MCKKCFRALQADSVFNIKPVTSNHFLQILQNLEFTYMQIPTVITETLIV
jgi:hypothetical protein